MVVVQLGAYSGASVPDWLAIQEAQRQVALADPLVEMIPACDQPLSDVIHLNVAGYKAVGARCADAVLEMHHGQRVDALADLTSAHVSKGQANKVTLDYDAKVSGGESLLFTVTDAVGAVAVTRLRTAGSHVTLMFDRSLVGEVRVTYGFPREFQHTWVRDGRGTAVACFTDVLATR